jgi:hypothetical protein
MGKIGWSQDQLLFCEISLLIVYSPTYLLFRVENLITDMGFRNLLAWEYVFDNIKFI